MAGIRTDCIVRNGLPPASCLRPDVSCGSKLRKPHCE